MRDHPLRQHLETQLQRAEQLPHAYVSLHADEARLQLEHALSHPPSPQQVLHGRTVAVKDLFDVAGQVTLAGGVLFGPQHLSCAPAQRDAEAVARLKAAGAVVLGRSNMSEFAFSGVGINPHWGTPANPCDPNTPRIPGGSSSGSAVAVAAHAADIGLGTDTGGSLRIPAALCGIVGFKATASTVPQAGCYPLSHSLDTVGAMARSVDEVITIHEVLSGQTVPADDTPIRARRIGVVRQFMTDGMDATVSRAWQRSLQRLTEAGAQLVDWDSALLAESASLQQGRSIVTAEAFRLHQDWLGPHAAAYDPRVLMRIRMGEHVDDAAYAAVLAARRDWIERMSEATQGFDVLIAPTVPIVAPPIAEIAPGAERDSAFFATNQALLRNTSAINFLDGCALSIPCQHADELPVGLMIWQRGGQDATVLRVAQAIANILGGAVA